MIYAARDYSYLLGMDDFSERMMEMHLALYQGYVNNVNRGIEWIRRLVRDETTNTPAFAGLKRRFGWEFNGMRLHEYYFDNLGGNGVVSQYGVVAERLSQQFGSLEAWEQDFRATGMMRGVGWVILYEDRVSSILLNYWVGEHDCGHPAGCNPLLVMDLFEHAYIQDFGLNKATYIETFLRNVHWGVVEARMLCAKS